MIIYTLVLSFIPLCLGKQDIGFFWHITDIHVDQNYSRTGNPNNLCHAEKTQYPDNGLFGNFLCDAPQYLINITFQSMRKIKPNPDFIIWTGDNLPHTSSKFDPDWNVIFEAFSNITSLFEDNFPGVPVFPCIGNHDTFPPNILLPNETSKSIYYDILNRGGWKKYLKDDAISTFIEGGFYSQLISPKLRIISLNTILWYSPNNFTEKMTDPLNQFIWLDNVLRNSSESSEMVYIIGHVPPGFYNRVKPGEKSLPTYHPQFLERYFEILKKYTNIIKGQMFGHLHIDMFQLFLLESGYFWSYSILASSVSPWHFKSEFNLSIPVNPSIRLLHYDTVLGILKDYDQFFLNLTKANTRKISEDSNYYELLYTFTKAYNVPDITTESLVAVFEMLKNDDAVFDQFFNFSTAGKRSVVCDLTCKVAQLCSISSTSIETYESCMDTKSIPCHSDKCTIVAHEATFNYLILVGLIFMVSILVSLFFVYRKYKKQPNGIYSNF